MEKELSNVDRLLKARSEIDDELRRHKSELTILFTDIVGSTSYFDRYGDTAGFAMVQRHAGIATSTFTEYQGRIIKMIGDSVMAEFPDPATAVRASVELQRRLAQQNQRVEERERILLRIAINAGRGFRHDNDVYGDAVNMAARICKKTGPAQILISRSVRDAVISESDVRCTWLGKVTLSGKAEPEDIFEVVWTDTAQYQALRQNATAAFVRGDIVSPGLSPEELLQPKQAATPAFTPPPASATPVPESGAAVTEGRYELLEELGRGGMGLVYKARDRDTGELVALKVLKPEIANQPTVFERFKNELRIARRITHKNVCRIYDLHRTGTTACIAMEFVEGDSLRQVLERTGRLDLTRGLRVVRQISSGLREAHEQGVVHRDLKPENIMLDRTGNVKLMDFGIARTEGAGLTFTGGIIGTPAYMSPEQAEGRAVDLRTDIYALGLVMYEVFTGRTAFHGDTPIAIALKQIRETPPLPRTHLPELPTFLEAAIMKCLQKDPAARFQSLEELDAALERAGAPADEAEVAAAPTPAPPAVPVAEPEPGVAPAAAMPVVTPPPAVPAESTPPPQASVTAAAAKPAATLPVMPPAGAERPPLPPVGITAKLERVPAGRTRWILLGGAGVAVALVAGVALLRDYGPPSAPAEEAAADIAAVEGEPLQETPAEPVAESPSPVEAAEETSTAPREPEPTTRAAAKPEPPGRAPVQAAAAPAQPAAARKPAAEAARPPAEKTVASAAPAAAEPTPPPNLLAVALANAEAAEKAGRLLEPAGNSALYWSGEALRLDSTNARAQLIRQRVVQSLLSQAEVQRRQRNYDAALATLAQVRRHFPDRGDLPILEQSIRNEMGQQGRTSATAAAVAGVTHRFNFSHRHPSMTAKDWVAENFYCSGVLTVTPDGGARFDCVSTQDPQKRCHNVQLPPGSVAQVTFNRDGSLRLNTHGHGQWDFYGERTSLQQAYAALARGQR